VAVTGVQPVFAGELAAAGGRRALQPQPQPQPAAIAGFRLLVSIRAAAAAASPVLSAALAAGTNLAAAVSASVAAAVASGSLMSAVVAANPACVAALGYSSAAALLASTRVDPTRPTRLVAAPLPSLPSRTLSDGIVALIVVGASLAAMIVIGGVLMVSRTRAAAGPKAIARAPSARQQHQQQEREQLPSSLAPSRRLSHAPPSRRASAYAGDARTRTLSTVQVELSDSPGGRRPSVAAPASRRPSVAAPASRRSSMLPSADSAGPSRRASTFVPSAAPSRRASATMGTLLQLRSVQ